VNQASLPLPEPNDVYALVRANASIFRDDFPGWLAENAHVWLAFEREANKVWDRGRRHYSGRTIIEVLRHNSALADTGPVYKINDHYTPDMSRLYRLVHPARAELFATRVLPGSERAA
jgi:hypothetical protein